MLLIVYVSRKKNFILVTFKIGKCDVEECADTDPWVEH